MFRKNVLLFILIIIMVMSPLLASCSGDGDDASDTSKTQNAEFPLEQKTFDTEINILCSSNHNYGSMQFQYDEEKENNVINEAVKRRNDLISQNYGITINTVNTMPWWEGITDLTMRIETGDDAYQLVALPVGSVVPKAQSGYFYSLNNLLLLDEAWYDQNAIEQLSLTDKVYFVGGDALITDDDMTFLFLYNKSMYMDNASLYYEYGDLYQIVREGRWTVDMVTEMSKVVFQPDENGAMLTGGCTYGYLGEGYGTNVLVTASGSPSAYKSSDGEIILNVMSEENVNAFIKVFNLMTNSELCIRAQHFGGTDTEEQFRKMMLMFVEGRGLFYQIYTSYITSIMNLDVEKKVDFGILPVPKHSEDQERYYCNVNAYHATVLCIPVTNVQNLEATAYLVEALGFYSRNTPGESSVIDAYYETTLKLRGAETQDDADMLDLIFSSRIYDIGAIFNWGGNLLGIYSACVSAGNMNIQSVFESYEDNIRLAIEQTMAEYATLDT